MASSSTKALERGCSTKRTTYSLRILITVFAKSPVFHGYSWHQSKPSRFRALRIFSESSFSQIRIFRASVVCEFSCSRTIRATPSDPEKASLQIYKDRDASSSRIEFKFSSASLITGTYFKWKWLYRNDSSCLAASSNAVCFRQTNICRFFFIKNSVFQ